MIFTIPYGNLGREHRDSKYPRYVGHNLCPKTWRIPTDVFHIERYYRVPSSRFDMSLRHGIWMEVKVKNNGKRKY